MPCLSLSGRPPRAQETVDSVPGPRLPGRSDPEPADATPPALAGTSVSVVKGAPAGLREARIALGDGGFVDLV